MFGSNKNNDLQDRVKQVESEISPILKKYNVILGAIPHFPIYNQLPVEVNLALEVLKKHGVQYTIAFKEGKDGN